MLSANSALFKFKQKIAGETGDDGRKDVKIMTPSKNFSNFWRTLEMILTNCEINLILTWSANFVISNAAANQITKLCVPVLILSTDDNGKLLQQLKSGFKRTINWNKYQSKARMQVQNRYLDYLIDPSFQGVNGLLFYHF